VTPSESNGTSPENGAERRHVMSSRFSEDVWQKLQVLQFAEERRTGYRASYSALLSRLIDKEYDELGPQQIRQLKAQRKKTSVSKTL